MSPRPDPLPGTLAWSAQTDRGRVRQNNEDSFLALTFDGREVRYLGKTGEASLAGSDFVFAVSDGMGGAKSGEFASKITVERITRLLPASFKMAARGLDRGFKDVLEELFASIHREMLKLGNSYEELSGMGATLSLTWFTPGWCYFGHIGDSRIYHLPASGGITQVTHDHTYVGWLRRTGKLNEREARAHPGKNSLNQALGAQHQFVEPHIGAVGCTAGDRFLICSDGLIDGLWDDKLEDMIRNVPAGSDGHSTAQRLVRAAVELSGRDNATAVVVGVGGSSA
jgi:serine/threonine protein phosphatase PrpC